MVLCSTLNYQVTSYLRLGWCQRECEPETDQDPPCVNPARW